MTDLTSEAMDALVTALRSGEQADMDGTMVRVSRQACEEAADIIARLTAERDAALAQVAGAYEAAADACNDYPRYLPDDTEWPLYDEQISHSQETILALTTAEARAALNRLIAAAVAAEREACAKVAASFGGGDPVGAGDGMGTRIASPVSAAEIAAAIRARGEVEGNYGL